MEKKRYSSWVSYDSYKMVSTYAPVIHDLAHVVSTNDLKIQRTETQYYEPPKDPSIERAFQKYEEQQQENQNMSVIQHIWWSQLVNKSSPPQMMSYRSLKSNLRIVDRSLWSSVFSRTMIKLPILSSSIKLTRVLLF